MTKTITAIKVQKRNPNRVSIELDGEYAFGLSRIVGAWLKIGDCLTEEKITSLQEQDSDEVAYQRSLMLIGYKPRTEKEISQKLAEKNFTAEQIEQTIERLKGTGLLQDAAFAKAWVENRNAFHPRSQHLIGYELKQKGITEELIETALQDSENDDSLAFHAATQFARRLNDLDWLTFRKKLSAHLARRGFDYGTISSTVKLVWEQKNLDGTESGKNEEYEE